MRGSYSVNGVGAGVTLIPSDAPTVSDGDEIAVTAWVRVPIDLTSDDFDEGESSGIRGQRLVVSYTVRARPGEPPYLLQTYAAPGPGAMEVQYPFIVWIGEGAYQITQDPDVAKHRLSPVQPRPIRIDPDAQYRVRTIILDPPSDQEQVVDIEPISGNHWFATRGTPLSAEDTGSLAGTWYRVELLPAVDDDDTVIEAYEVTGVTDPREVSMSTFLARLNYENEIVIVHGGEDRDFALTPTGLLPTVIAIPASEEWDASALDSSLEAAGWQRVGAWTSHDVDATAVVAPKAQPYFRAQARKAFTEAGGDPAHAGALAAWAEALRTGPRYDSRIGVIVGEDGTLLAETRHVPATGWSAGATYVVTELDPAAAEVRDQEVGLACGALRRITGQGVIHVTASKVCTGAGKFLTDKEAPRATD